MLDARSSSRPKALSSASRHLQEKEIERENERLLADLDCCGRSYPGGHTASQRSVLATCKLNFMLTRSHAQGPGNHPGGGSRVRWSAEACSSGIYTLWITVVCFSIGACAVADALRTFTEGVELQIARLSQRVRPLDVGRVWHLPRDNFTTWS